MPAEFVLPAGLLWSTPPDPPPEEGFELTWRPDEEPPQYFWYVQLSSLRLERIFPEALRCLPPHVHAVLEMRRPVRAEEDDADGDGDDQDDELRRADDGDANPDADRWVSPPRALEDVLRVVSKYSLQILHDGMTGFGAYDPDSPLEVFLDDHKLLHLFAPDLEPFSALLARHRVEQVERIRTVLDTEHEHLPLASLPDRCPQLRRDWLRRRRYDPEWFAPAIRRALRMRAAAPDAPGREGDAPDEDDPDATRDEPEGRDDR